MATNIWDDATGITFGDLQSGRVKKPQQQADSAKQIPQGQPAVSGPASTAKAEPTGAPTPVPAMPVPAGIAANTAPNQNAKPPQATFNNLPTSQAPADPASAASAPSIPPAAPNPIFMGVPDGIAKNMAPNPNRKPAPETFNNLPAVSASPAPTSVPVPVATSAPVTAPKAVAATEENLRPVEMDPFAYRGGQSFGGKGPVNGPDSTALDQPQKAAGYTVEKGDTAAARIRGAHQSILEASPSAAKTQAAANANESDLAGRQGAYMIENNLRQLEDKGNGVIRTVGRGGIAEFTNVGTSGITDPAKKIAVNSYDGAADNASLSKANAIRQEMIDRMPQGGIAVLDDGTAAANAEKTRRWQIDEVRSAMRGAGTRTERAALGQLLNTMVSGQNQLQAEEMRTQAAMRNHDVQAGVTMRGQDMTSRNEAARIAGNPIDQQMKQEQVKGIAATNEGNALIADLQKRAIGGDAQALSTLNALSGKTRPATDRYLTVQGGEEIGPDGITKVKRSSGVFDAQTGAFVPMDRGGQSQDAQAKAAQIKADTKAGKISRDDAIKQLQSLGYK